MTVNREMEQETLQTLHDALLYLTDEVDRICQKYGITYSLTGGSMLGAVRHKGFIPWDDDMDLAMLRPEYECFLRACNTDLGEDFEIQTIESDPEYFLGYGKLLLKGTSLVQHGHEETKYKKAIFIDIFPLDSVPDDPLLRTRQGRKNYLYNKLLERKGRCKLHNGEHFNKRVVYGLLKVISFFVPANLLKKRMIQNITTFDGTETKYVCNFGGYYGYKKETTLRKYFKKIVYVPFENRRYPISKYFDEYLKEIYGDYMKLPPVEKRHTHDFQHLDFGNYVFLERKEN